MNTKHDCLELGCGEESIPERCPLFSLDMLLSYDPTEIAGNGEEPDESAMWSDWQSWEAWKLNYYSETPTKNIRRPAA